jgi:regulator of sirC expression with transglutaminase-like and TPR domain
VTSQRQPPVSPRERFAALATLPDREIDVALAALLIAAEARPGLDVTHYRDALAALGQRAAERLADVAGAAARARALARFLHDEVGLRGNQRDYYDPHNSYLSDVLDRGLGIPITLAIVYVDVARRVGLRAAGVGFPGHFLASVATEDGSQVLVDAFAGRALDLVECHELLVRTAGPGARVEPAMLAPASPREIVARVLRNLKQIHAERGELDAALACSERILLLFPSDATEQRDRRQLAGRRPARKDWVN